MSKEWFGSWFDSKYYHTLYQNRDFSEAEAFISNLIAFLKPGKKAKILDLACGKGRHSFFLNQLGYDVTGVDLSPQSIQFASKRSNDRLRFFTHDMRGVEKHGPYDYIFNLFTSFGYFDDDQEDLNVLNSVEQSLNDDSIFILDFLNPTQVIANLVPEEVKELDGISFFIRRYVESNFIVKTIKFEADGKKHEFQERVKILELNDFENLFSQTNLKIEKVFGAYDLTDFDSTNSERQIILARKN